MQTLSRQNKSSIVIYADHPWPLLVKEGSGTRGRDADRKTGGLRYLLWMFTILRAAEFELVKLCAIR